MLYTSISSFINFFLKLSDPLLAFISTNKTGRMNQNDEMKLSELTNTMSIKNTNKVN